MSFRSLSVDQPYHPYIDGLRGIAVLMVLAHHAVVRIESPFAWSQFKHWLERGERGVPLFFILSAMTLFSSLGFRFFQERHPIRNFYLRRAFRILPFFYLNVAYCAFVSPVPFTTILANLTFTFGFSTDLSLRIVPGSWSLFVEETFYLVFPLLFLKLWNDIRWVIFGLVAMAMTKVFWTDLMMFQGFKEDQEQIWGGPLSRYYWFFIGILVAKYLLTNKDKQLSSNEETQLPVLFDLVCVVGLINIHRFDDLTGAMCLAFLVVVASFSNSLVGKFCRTRVLGLFGRCCFSIYFIHFYAIEWLEPLRRIGFDLTVWPSLSGELQFLIYASCVASVSLLVSFVTFSLIEVPSVRLGQRFIASRQSK